VYGPVKSPAQARLYWLPRELILKLEDCACELGLTRVWVVRQALVEYLARWERQRKAQKRGRGALPVKFRRAPETRRQRAVRERADYYNRKARKAKERTK
jgi:hypothetical protein